MKHQFCLSCRAETWHNPCARKSTGSQEYRCVQCARPFRSGNIHPKNLVCKRWDGRIFFGTTTV